MHKKTLFTRGWKLVSIAILASILLSLLGNALAEPNVLWDASVPDESWSGSWSDTSSGYDGQTEGEFRYEIVDGKATVTGYFGGGGDVVVPDTLGGCPVTSIGLSAFSKTFDVRSVKLPNGIETIGENAFYDCNLTSINFPEGLKSIGAYAFEDCYNLTSIALPASVTSIEYAAFGGCGDLESIDVQAGNPVYEAVGNCLIEKSTGKLIRGCANSIIPSSVKVIGEYAFSNCDFMTFIVPNGVTTIEYDAFYGCNNLCGLFIPSSVTTLVMSAFGFCNRLTVYCEAKEQPEGWEWDGYYDNIEFVWGTDPAEAPVLGAEGAFTYLTAKGTATVLSYDGWEETVTVPDTLGGCPVTAIGVEAFQSTDTITSVNLPGSITTIRNFAFYNCYTLENIELPDGVTKIGGEAFANCDSIRNFHFPADLETIGNSAFRDCDALQSVEIPASVTSIGSYAFSVCNRLTTITVQAGNPNYEAIDNCLIEKATGTLLVGCGNVIPNGVKVIGEGAFQEHESLTSIVIPDGVTTIKDYAFVNCPNLISLFIPDSVTEISYAAFENCYRLTIYCEAKEQPETWSSYWRPDWMNVRWGASLADLPVLETEGDYTYRTADGKSTILAYNGAGGNVTVPDTLGGHPVTAIGSGAFFVGYISDNHYDLQSVIIPSGVTSIGAFAFCENYDLTTVFIPASVTEMEQFAFDGSYKLKIYCEAKEQPEGWDELWLGWDFYPENIIWGASLSDLPIQGTEGDYTYVMENKKTTIVSYDGEGGDVTVPGTLGGHPVTAIGNNAFESYNSLESIELPDSVTEIGEEAFEYCRNLERIKLPANLETIGDRAFTDCYRLTSIELPDGVTSIGRYAFYLCYDLTSITIPASVTEIGEAAFGECRKLASITVQDGNPRYEVVNNCLIDMDTDTLLRGCNDSVIPNGVQKIGDHAFSGCNEMIIIVIPDGVTRIGFDAFGNCDNLTNVAIPDSVTAIEGNAFHGCENLTNIFIPASVTEMDRDVFRYCDRLTIYCEANERPASWDEDWISEDFGSERVIWGVSREDAPVVGFENDFVYTVLDGKATVTAYTGPDGDVTVPETLGGCPVTVIGTDAFNSCGGLTSIVLPSCLETIEANAFFDCYNLESLTIPASVTLIEECAFGDCRYLHITVQTGNANYESTGNCLIEKASGLLLHGRKDSVIPSNVKVIGTEAFRNCNIPSINIPDSVTTIKDRAFMNCYNLESIFIPASVTQMGQDVFEYCYAAIYCEAAEQPEGWDAGWTGQYYPPEVHWGASREDVPFVGVEGDLMYVVKDGKATITDYISSSRTVTIPATIGGYPVTAIGEFLFYENEVLESIELPNSITEIGDKAFYNCYNLKTIKLPTNLETIGYRAFSSSGLTSITIPASVTFIGDEAFSYCGLDSITVQSGNANYESTGNCLVEKSTNALLCGSNASVIPNTVKVIADQAFTGCIGLTSVTIPNGVTTIGYYAFSNTGLTSITIPASVKEIRDCAFNYCSGLRSITVQAGNPNYESVGNCLIEKSTKTLLCGCATSVIPSGVKVIGEEAFSVCHGLTSIVIPDSVTTIAYDAFWACDSLTSVVIPNSVTEIGINAFGYCTALKSIVIPKSVVKMGWSVFTGCDGLTVYCEAASEPYGWDPDWLGYYEEVPMTVQWGYQPPVKPDKPDEPDKPDKPVVVGDLSGDGKVNSTDYMLLKRHVLGTYKLSDAYLAFADFSGDDKVNSTDYMLLKRAVLGTYKLPTA